MCMKEKKERKKERREREIERDGMRYKVRVR